MLAENTSFVKEGLLIKKGMGQLYRPWAERNFRLDADYTLGYYKNGILRGAINIVGCTIKVLRASEADGRSFAFSIENPLVLVSGSTLFKSQDMTVAAFDMDEVCI